MTVHRFFIDPSQIEPRRVRILGDAASQIQRVLRLRPDAVVELFDGSGRQVRARLVSVSPVETVAEPLETTYPAVERAAPVHLVQALLKGERLEWVIEKATELGVATIALFPAARSVVRLGGERIDRKLARWGRIAREAAEQSGRVRLPDLEWAESLESALEALQDAHLLVADEAAGRDGGATDLRAIGGTAATHGIVILIGPEGGWDDRERALLRDRGAERISLGPRILRAETAAIAALASLGEGGE